MKRYFWIGLLTGICLNVLALAFVFNATAQKNGPADSASPAAAPAAPNVTAPVGSAFTYQGLIKKNGALVNGSCDFQFKLFSDPNDPGSQVNITQEYKNQPVKNGVFTVVLDFGAMFDGSMRYIEALASCPASASPSYTTLPRQPIYAAPYAMALMPGALINDFNSANMDTLLIISSSSRSSIAGINNDNAVTSAGVYGLGTSGATGVYGEADTPVGIGVWANNTYGGSALTVKGEIHVKNIGGGVNAPVFTHHVNTGAGGNLCATQNYATVIDNPMFNGEPGAMLIVTPNYGANNGGAMPAVGIPGVYYDATNACGKGAGKWVIYTIDGVNLLNNSMYNVMGVLP